MVLVTYIYYHGVALAGDQGPLLDLRARFKVTSLIFIYSSGDETYEWRSQPVYY